MPPSAQTQAVLLLTAYLGKPARGEPRPLSTSEWGRFAAALKERSLQPESLLTGDAARMLAGWLDRTVDVPRIEALLRRGGALGFAMEKWERAGLWIITRSESEYPERLKRRLRTESPPLLFGCGNRQLLGRGGLAVIGSRDASDADLKFAAELGAKASQQGQSIISGGARGIDEAAMLGALQQKGRVVGVLADSLLRAAVAAKYRPYLLAGNLALISTFNPEAGFEVGNAMARNRYIYCLADAAVAVTSSAGRGGTWTGAKENLKEGWVPLWVKPSSDESSGNAALVREGARWLPDGPYDPAWFQARATLSAIRAEAPIQAPEAIAPVPRTEAPTAVPSAPQRVAESETAAGPGAGTASLFDVFLQRFRDLTHAAPLSLDELQDRLDVVKPQLNVWLLRGAEQGCVEKLRKPVRYRWQETSPSQPSMFAEAGTDSEEEGSRLRRGKAR